jgi:hypothetical protein
MTEPVAQQDLNEALDRLWNQFLPQIEERVAAVETASRALSAGELSDELRDEARGASHKLAGILGTFGLTKGTILAREAEMLFSGDSDPAMAERLVTIAAQLRAMIAGRK